MDKGKTGEFQSKCNDTPLTYRFLPGKFIGGSDYPAQCAGYNDTADVCKVAWKDTPFKR